jgi:hypothetical protein
VSPTNLTVDLHQHVIPGFYWEASNEDGNAAGGINPPRWSLSALDVLDLDGVSLMTNAGGSYLGDARFDPIFAELQRRAAVVFVHPTACGWHGSPPDRVRVARPSAAVGLTITVIR